MLSGEIVVDDSFDNGIVDSWRIELGGRPLEAVAGRMQLWRFENLRRAMPGQGTLPVYATVDPCQRTYWRSKQGEARL